MTSIIRSKSLSAFIGGQIDNLDVDRSDRRELAGACFHISLIHHHIIPHLLEGRQYAPAFALLRPLMESYIRGLWLWRSATDDEIENFKRGDRSPSALKLLDRVEREGYLEENSLSAMAKEGWGTVSDYTHTGIRVVSRHLTGHSIEPDFEQEEIDAFLRVCDAWCLMVAVAIAGLANRLDVGERLLIKAEKMATE